MNAYEITEVWAKSTFKYWEETANILQENLDRLYDACKEYEKEYYLCNYRQTACPYATLNGYCKLTACLFNLSLTCRKGRCQCIQTERPQ